MSDLRVNTKVIERAFLQPPADHVWNVSPVWLGKEGDRRLVLPEAETAVDSIVRGVTRIFEAKTMQEHRDAVEVLSHDLVWDGPPIRLTNKGHVRLAAYLFKYFAHLSIIPVAAAVSQPSPGRQLIELDAVAVSKPHRVWWLPATLLLPREIPKNIHMKIGVITSTGGTSTAAAGNLSAAAASAAATGGVLASGTSGIKVELLMGRLTNLPAFLPAWLRSINGIAMGALPHALEDLLGYGFDWIEGGDYYRRKREAAFRARHPTSTSPTLEWLEDLAHDAPRWAQEQGQVLLDSWEVVLGDIAPSFLRGPTHTVLGAYGWAWSTAWSTVGSLVNNAVEVVKGATEGMGSGSYSYGAAGSGIGSPYRSGAGAAGGIRGAQQQVAGRQYKGPVVVAGGAPGRPVGGTNVL